MTPLAMEVVKELVRPVKDRTSLDHGRLVQNMDDIHCFDVTDVHEMCHSLGKESVVKGSLVDSQEFLPAPKTWIEWKDRFGNRWGCHCMMTDLPTICGFKLAFKPVGCQWRSLPDLCLLNLGWSSDNWNDVGPVHFAFDQENRRIYGSAGQEEVLLFASRRAGLVVLGALACINSPKIIGRRQHMPHRGLERDLVKRQSTIGSFPLRAWTEILLDVSPPAEAEGQHEFEAHLTGSRALHFVRAHLRIRDGKLIFVKAHWRGDASKGIKRSRYKVSNRQTGSGHMNGPLNDQPSGVSQ